jgi:hypothetical protein
MGEWNWSYETYWVRIKYKGNIVMLCRFLELKNIYYYMMNPIEFKIHVILDNKYDIETEDYWELPEEDKEYITEIMVKEILLLSKKKRIDLSFYISEIDDRRLDFQEYEEYESAEITRRIVEKLSNYYS